MREHENILISKGVNISYIGKNGSFHILALAYSPSLKLVIFNCKILRAKVTK